MMANEFNLTYQHHEMQYPSHEFNNYTIIIIIIASLQAQWKQMNPLTFLVQYQQKILDQMVMKTVAVISNLDCIHRNEHTILYILP